MCKFNKIIYNLREDTEPKLKQNEIGEKLGMSQRKISRLERGDTEPTIEEIKKYCEYYNLSADYILGFTNKQEPLRKEGDPKES